MHTDFMGQTGASRMQVADVLADGDTGPWLSTLKHRILSIDWAAESDSSDCKAADEMLGHLLSLPNHLLHRVLSCCLADMTFEALLGTLPSFLHDALIPCAATDGTLTLPATADDPFYYHLSQASFPGPGLLTLANPVGGTSEVDSCATAALLSRALSAHRSLETVDMPHMCAAALQTFCASLLPHALPCLQEFHLSTDGLPGGAVAASECLKKFPSLSDASVRFVHGHECRDAPASGCTHELQSRIRSIACPAHLPHLTELLVEEEGSVHNSSAGCATQFISFLSAPALRAATVKTSATAGSSRALLASLARFPGLELLTIDSDLRGPQKEPRMPAAVYVQPVSLPALLEARVIGRCTYLPLRMAAAVANAAPTCLTHLSVSRCQRTDATAVCREGSQREVEAAFTELWGAVSSCSSLQYLQVSLLCRVRLSNGEAMASSLKRLPMLTQLVLEAEQTAACRWLPKQGCCLSGTMLGAALRKLRSLRELHISSCGAPLETADPDALLRGIASLKELSLLGLWVDGVLLPDVTTVLPKLRCLTKLVLRPEWFEGQHKESMSALQNQFASVQIVSAAFEGESENASDDAAE